jgi:uncharacterized protein (DUF1697 family)
MPAEHIYALRGIHVVKTYVAMLRGINVGGQKVVKMEALRAACESAGLGNVRTYVQSGNVVFEQAEKKTRDVEVGIMDIVKKEFGFDVAVVARTGEELASVVANLPLVGKDPDLLHVTFLSEEPPSIPAERLGRAKQASEEYVIRGREIYLFCPNGYGGTKLSNTFFEGALEVSATTRNWRTVNALLAMTKS